MTANQIALQLYTVREQTAQDMLGTLRKLAEMGYRAVEFAGYGNSTPQEIRSVLDEVGMQAISAHVSLQLFQENQAKVLEDLKTLGCEYAIVPFSPDEYRGSPENVQKLAERLNTLGKAVEGVQLRFGYHNHGFEFADVQGSTMYDRLAAQTDPELVTLELDVFWAQHAGADPLPLIERYAGRMPLIHVKDMAAGEGREDTPVGTGIMPWARILATAKAAGAQWYIVEQDHPQDAMVDVRTSLQHLQTLLQQV